MTNQVKNPEGSAFLLSRFSFGAKALVDWIPCRVLHVHTRELDGVRRDEKFWVVFAMVLSQICR
jgi:hypothetical protein